MHVDGRFFFTPLEQLHCSNGGLSLNCIVLLLHTPQTHTDRPSSLDTLKRVEGVSDVWVTRYGEIMLTVIKDVCRQGEGEAPMDVFHQQSAQPEETFVEVSKLTLSAKPFHLHYLTGSQAR